MRYLVHSEDAIHNTVTGRYEIILDKRIPNPRAVTVTQANFIAASAESYPPVVYFRSNALTRLATRKQAVELKASGHEDRTDVICALQESHTIGRYHLNNESSVSFRTKRDGNITKLDFYFTDNRTAMPDGGVAVSNNPASAYSTAADIELLHGMNRVCIWLPMTQSTLLQNSFLPVENVGDDTIRKVLNRSTGAPQNILFSTYANVAWGVLGQTNSIFGGNASWNSAFDSTNNTLPDPAGGGQDYSFSCLFKAPTAPNSYFFESPQFRLFLTGGSVEYRSGDYNVALTDISASSGVQFFPNHDYLFSFTRRSDVNAGVKKIYIRSKNLTTNGAEQTFTGPDAYFPYVTGEYLRIASAATGWNLYLGPTIYTTGGNIATEDMIRSYLEGLYLGEVAPEEGEPVVSTVTAAEWFVELDITGTEN